MGFHQTDTHRNGKHSYHQIGLVRGQFGDVPEDKWLDFIAEAGFDGWEESSWELDLKRCATDEGAAAELAGWDGAWYRRAFFDDGCPLGSSNSPECQIDLLPQSWAALSGMGEPGRAKQALQAVLERIETPNAHTAVFYFRQPYGPLLQRLDVVEARTSSTSASARCSRPARSC